MPVCPSLFCFFAKSPSLCLRHINFNSLLSMYFLSYLCFAKELRLCIQTVHLSMFRNHEKPCPKFERWRLKTSAGNGKILTKPHTSKGKGGIPRVPLKKDRNALCISGKVQWSSAPLLQLFRIIHSTSVSLSSNVIKLQV